MQMVSPWSDGILLGILGIDLLVVIVIVTANTYVVFAMLD